MGDILNQIKANPVAKILAQIEQNTRSERTAVLYKTRSDLGVGRVKVKLRATVYAITDIDNVKQEFTANLSIRARWKEPLFRGASVKEDIDWDDQWNPRIELDNAVQITNFDRKYELRYFPGDEVEKIPHVCLTMNITATFKEMFELDEFPIDYQALNIWLISEWPFDQLELAKDDEFMDHLTVSTFTESKEWELFPQIIGEPVGEPNTHDEITGSTSQYPLYTITTHVKRRHYYYLYTHILYMFMIFATSLTTFTIPLEEGAIGQRLTSAFLILLGALLFRLLVQPSLPLIAYWTAMDKYSHATMFCHFLIILEHTVIAIVVRSGGIDTARNVDLACMGGIISISVAFHVFFLAFYFQTVKKRDKFLQEETKNYEEVNNLIRKLYTNKKSNQHNGKWRYEAPTYHPNRSQRDHYFHSPNTERRQGLPPTKPMRIMESPRTPRGTMRNGNHLPPLNAHRPVLNHGPTDGPTHEVQINMPAVRSSSMRSRSNSRGRTRRRSRSVSSHLRNNKVAAANMSAVYNGNGDSESEN